MKHSPPVYLVLLLLLSACTGAGLVLPLSDPHTETPVLGTEMVSRGSDAPAGLTVAAAADLQFAFSDLAVLFKEQTGQEVTLVFGSTGQLTQQIENGAPYDLIAAANIEYIQRLAAQQLVIEDSIALYARGRIVLAVNRRSGIQALELQDLLNPQIQHIAIANPEHAPYGVAAQQALQTLGLWEALQPRLVFGENIRQTLQYIQTGDAEAGIVALSVANVPEITWTMIDGSLHQPLDQALAVVASSAQPELAEQFALFINGEAGRLVMRRYGFILPGETPLMGPEFKP